MEYLTLLHWLWCGLRLVSFPGFDTLWKWLKIARTRITKGKNWGKLSEASFWTYPLVVVASWQYFLLAGFPLVFQQTANIREKEGGLGGDSSTPYPLTAAIQTNKMAAFEMAFKGRRQKESSSVYVCLLQNYSEVFYFLWLLCLVFFSQRCFCPS